MSDSPSGRPEGEINPPLTLTLKLEPDHPYLTGRGPLPEMVKLFGLGCARRGMMQGRICIPIHNILGELIAYAGRWPGQPPEGVPRYLFPPNFRKSHALFNLHRVTGSRHLVLVEGFWSVFRLHSLRIPSVAVMGSSLSAEQETLLAGSGVRAMTLMLDGDEAGRTAAAEILPRLAGWCFVRRADLPDGSQPDTIKEAELLRYAR